MEAVKNGNDKAAALLYREGARLDVKDVGSFLCTAVLGGDVDYLRRILANGIDPNSKDYDYRTPLHVACSQGLYLMAKVLVEAGAYVTLKDRYAFTYNMLKDRNINDALVVLAVPPKQ